MNRTLACVVAVCGLAAAGSVHGQIVSLQHLRTVNAAGTSNQANPYFIGTNPYSIAFNGSRMFVGGLGNATQSLSVVEITDYTTNPASPTFGNAFAPRVTPNGSNGYTGLALSADGNTLYSSFDGGATATLAVQAWDVSVPMTPPASPTWSVSPAGGTAFRGSHVAIDPGHNGGGVAAGGGVGYVSINNGRVGRIDPNGTPLFSAITGAAPLGANGYSFFVSPPGSSVVRGMDFNPATGDGYYRVLNNVVRTIRTGPNAVTASQAVDLGDSTGIGANIAFMSIPGVGNISILNDVSVSAGSSFGAFIKGYNLGTTTGAAPAVTFDFGSFDTTWTSSGLFDFAYDPGTQTLAVLNTSTGRIDMFWVVPTPASGGLLGLAGLVAFRRRR